MESEGPTLGGQLKRHKDLMGSLIRLLPHLGDSGDTLEKARVFERILGNLKGPMMKIGQLFGNIPDMLPEPYAQSFRALQCQAPSMGWPFVKRRMAGELGPHWESLFDKFDKKASFAASLGQVHRARLVQGDEVALKLQYPNMASVMKADLGHLKMWMKVYGALGGALDLTEIFSEIENSLLGELDYYQEARWCDQFKDCLQKVEGVSVPSPYPSLSTQKLLVLSWVEGASILSFKEGPAEIRNALARHLFEGWYRPFYQRGLLHGDPHMGNYRGYKDGSITLLDFGCVREFSQDFVGGVVDLYRALLHNDGAAMIHAYEAWGFKDLTVDLIDILNKWALFLYAPVLKDKKLKLAEVISSRSGQALAKEIYSLLKAQGKICPPRSFLFMDRVAVGLGSVFMHLDACLNWHELFEEIIQTRPMDHSHCPVIPDPQNFQNHH